MPRRPHATAILAGLALVGFAGNSLLTRLALAEHAIDAGSFTAVRLASGAVLLAALVVPRGGVTSIRAAGSWAGAGLLFAYAGPFSFAYLELGAGVGALVLFGAVQLTMIGWGLVRGERPRPAEWLGLVASLGGLGALGLRGAAAPAPLGLGLMVAAGIAWGAYSLRGRGVVDPTAATAGNFALAVPLVAALWLVELGFAAPRATPRGLACAVASGALASGLGYALWYAALPGLTRTQAAMVQLTVPALAAGAAIPLLGERLSLRLVVAGGLILGGVALAMVGRARR